VLAAAKLLAAAAVGYVLTRAGAIFLGWVGAAVVVPALVGAAYAASRREQWAVVVGLAAGAALSALALML
jgi:hypothetical protein